MSDLFLDLSRLQFALTVMYHFIFVPLTLGMAFMLAIMESLYVLTQKPIYKEMTQFWGKLFGINFALGVATGLTMEFQFGMNWSYYSHYVGDIFGAPLAIEGLMAFFLESTMVGLFFFGWDRLSQAKHLMVTWLVALATNLSALWILIANGWMQFPVGSSINVETMRMEMTSFIDVILNPVAQVKFVHTVTAGYTTAACFVLAISAWYLLKKRNIAFAKRSFAVASSFGLVSIIAVIILGDESGYKLGDVQPVKLAAIEAEWETHEAPAPFTLIGIPDSEAEKTDFAVKIPALLGLIATRSLDEQVIGIKDLKKRHREYIKSGLIAYNLLDEVRKGSATPLQIAEFDANKEKLGYAYLVQPFTNNMEQPDKTAIDQAVDYSIPPVGPLYWSFRVMLLAGALMLVLFIYAFWASYKQRISQSQWLLKAALFALPLPWIACEAGWFVAEYGRQPWAIADILPLHVAVSNLSITDIVITLIAICAFYTLMFIAGMHLMLKFTRKGPYAKDDTVENEKNLELSQEAN